MVTVRIAVMVPAAVNVSVTTASTMHGYSNAMAAHKTPGTVSRDRLRPATMQIAKPDIVEMTATGPGPAMDRGKAAANAAIETISVVLLNGSRSVGRVWAAAATGIAAIATAHAATAQLMGPPPIMWAVPAAPDVVVALIMNPPAANPATSSRLRRRFKALTRSAFKTISIPQQNAIGPVRLERSKTHTTVPLFLHATVCVISVAVSTDVPFGPTQEAVSPGVLHVYDLNGVAAVQRGSGGPHAYNSPSQMVHSPQEAAMAAGSIANRLLLSYHVTTSAWFSRQTSWVVYDKALSIISTDATGAVVGAIMSRTLLSSRAWLTVVVGAIAVVVVVAVANAKKTAVAANCIFVSGCMAPTPYIGAVACALITVAWVVFTMASAYYGVIDPVPPSVDQCIQVILDPAQDQVRPAALAVANIPKQAWLLPRNIVTITSGGTWRTRVGVKRGREQTPVMPITGFASNGTEYGANEWRALRFAGVTIDGIHDMVNAKSNPNAAARLSIQMHGIASVFCPRTDFHRGVNPKFGDPVFIKRPDNSGNVPVLSIIGTNDGFNPFSVCIRQRTIGGADLSADEFKFVGWLVDAGPSDRHEIRVHLDPHFRAPGNAANNGDFVMAMGGMGDAGVAVDAPLAAEMPEQPVMAGASFSSASATGVAVAALSAAAEVAGHDLPFGAALIKPGMADTPEFQSVVRIAEEQEMHGMSMLEARQSALYGTNEPIDDVTTATADTLRAIYKGEPAPIYPDAVTTLQGSLTATSDIASDYVSAGMTSAGGAPAYMLRQSTLSDSTPITSSAPGVIHSSLRTEKWKTNIDTLLDKYRDAGPVSHMSPNDARALAADVRATLLI